MLSRGYFIGEIVDALSEVSAQASTRGRLGLTDLHKHAENFFMTILNLAYSYSLSNLNEERSNAPGLDLGDPTNGVAFQITTERTSQKVNHTLGKLTSEQIKAYPKVRILMIGGKQSTYSLDKELCEEVSFTEADIWDTDVLGKRCMDLPIDVLQSIYNHIRAEIARVRIDLEIPDAEGNFPTNIADYTEAIAKPRMSDLTKFNAYLGVDGDREPIETTRAALEALSKNLAALPRITREFLAVMIERRETEDRPGRRGDIEINADKLERISRYPDFEGELRVLSSYGFVHLDEPTESGESHYWQIRFPGTPGDYELFILDYIEKHDIALNGPLVSLDFTAF